jgi:cardiolipin synthase
VKRWRWTGGNRFTLLENGEAFFPRVFESIAAAQREVLLETFILFEDKVGLALRDALVAAARNGARVDITIDGYGSPDLSDAYLASLTSAGVRVHVFDPAPRILGWRPNVFRRLHRKLVVVDGVRAFIGGINYSADHLADFGPEAKQDYSVEVEGPVVGEMHRFALSALGRDSTPRRWFRRAPDAPGATGPAAGNAQALLVTRDNRDHPTDIERHYRVAIRAARQRVVIANAYFFPGYRLLRELVKAARRGVDVRLILQGEPDMPIVKLAAGLLYHHLLNHGVRVYEYCERPLHAKVALADDEWATVGSSNLDPLSLALNLEANVVIRDAAFNRQLSERLQYLMDHGCKQVQAHELAPVGRWHLLRSNLVFHALRHFPSWAGWLPAHMPRLAAVEPQAERPEPQRS